MTVTTKSRAVFNLGKQFTPEVEAPTRKVYNKASRRLLRRKWKRKASSIESALDTARIEINEARSLGKSSHARKRLERRLREENRR